MKRTPTAVVLPDRSRTRGFAHHVWVGFFLAFAALAAQSLQAATPAAKGTAGYASPRHVIASGGGSSSGGAFAVRGSIAQVDADLLQPSRGGVFAITGGFWAGIAPSAPQGELIFRDGFDAP
jgi:hypothetical protein